MRNYLLFIAIVLFAATPIPLGLTYWLFESSAFQVGFIIWLNGVMIAFVAAVTLTSRIGYTTCRFYLRCFYFAAIWPLVLPVLLFSQGALHPQCPKCGEFGEYITDPDDPGFEQFHCSFCGYKRRIC